MMIVHAEILEPSEIVRHTYERAKWARESQKIYPTWLLDRAEAAEQRAADLLEANRELTESVTILRAEVTQLTEQRDEARRELRELRLSIIETGTR